MVWCVCTTMIMEKWTYRLGHEKSWKDWIIKYKFQAGKLKQCWDVFTLWLKCKCQLCPSMARSPARAVQPAWPRLPRAVDVLTTAAHCSPLCVLGARGEPRMRRAGFDTKCSNSGDGLFLGFILAKPTEEQNSTGRAKRLRKTQWQRPQLRLPGKVGPWRTSFAEADRGGWSHVTAGRWAVALRPAGYNSELHLHSSLGTVEG